MPPTFAESLSQRVIVGDGAMGTMLYAKGIYINRCFDELNLTSPELVQEVHREYLAAGAELVETNTFGANTYKLSLHGLSDRVAEINRRGVEIAREVVGDRAWVGGSLGPLGVPIEPIGRVGFDEARDAFRVQAQALADGGVDLFLIETIRRLEEVREAISAVRDVSDQPIIAMVAITEELTSALGDPPEKIAASLDEWGADVIGLNCSVGPQPMLEAIQRMIAVTDRPTCVMPNAGAPRLVEGRYMYLSSPEYFAKYTRRFVQVGVRVVGGCCGTTPEHVKAMKRAVQSVRPDDHKRTPVGPAASVRVQETGVAPVPLAKKSDLAAKIAAGQFVSSVEIAPPKSPDPEKALQRIAQLKEAGVDAVNIPDGPRASARMSSAALAILAAQRVGIDVILHYCCRDRNLLSMQSDLLGAGAVGLRNILIITGDPPKLGDYPDATAVFDVD
ncbi:MAG: bifunctional homocysteine S-methyltransferase/methylenetetrahydrofolate reductase, partial [bacterium]